MWMIIYWMVCVFFGGQVFCQIVNLCLDSKGLLNLEPLSLYVVWLYPWSPLGNMVAWGFWPNTNSYGEWPVVSWTWVFLVSKMEYIKYGLIYNETNLAMCNCTAIAYSCTCKYLICIQQCIIDIQNLQMIRGNSLDHCLVDSNCVANFCSNVLWTLSAGYPWLWGYHRHPCIICILVSHECKSFSITLFTNSFQLWDWKIQSMENVGFKHWCYWLSPFCL